MSLSTQGTLKGVKAKEEKTPHKNDGMSDMAPA